MAGGAILVAFLLAGSAGWHHGAKRDAPHAQVSVLPSTHPPAFPKIQASAPSPGQATPPQPTGTASNTSSPSCLANDPTARLPVIASREESNPSIPGTIKRIRIVRADFKYPLWRVEETVRPGRQGQPDSIRTRTIMIADHAMVRLQSPVDEEKLKTLAASNGLTIRKAMKMPGCYLVETSDDSIDALPRLLATLSRDKTLIRYAEPDYIVRTQDTSPNDPYFPRLWGLHNTSLPGADISAPQAWGLTTGDTQVVIAVVDTGIDYRHPDLAANIWSNTAESANGADDDGNGYSDDVHGWNFADDNNDPMDGYGHGTHCAGTIGAAGNNGLGVAGINWSCKILPLKFISNNGYGADSDAADALHYVADLRRRGVTIRLTSNSWGGGDYSTTLRDAIREIEGLDILFVCAAGNDGMDIDSGLFYPACYGESNMVVVAATDSSDGLAYFSNYGASSVHLGAPGVYIYSTYPNSQYVPMSGTSMATPHVAGVATLLWNSWPSATGQDIRDAILRGTDPIPALSRTTITGGRLNAFKSLKALFRIIHTPLGNTDNTGDGYPIDAGIGPSFFLDTNSPSLFWNTDGSTNFTPTALVNISNSLYRATIPTQPEGTLIHYWMRAMATNGLVALSPTDASTNTWSFQVVPPMTLSVTGTPAAIATVTPPYGTFNYPSGNTFLASAPASTPPTNGMRWRCTGWTGTGSIPSPGTTNAFTFTLTNGSSLTWQWVQEVALVQTSTANTALNLTTWWPQGATATTLIANASTSITGTTYRFIGWELDGLRQPSPSDPAINPVTGIPMAGSRQANAKYLPENQDNNGNGIADWWEYFYFGTTNIAPSADDDGDGYSNLKEFLDRSNPRDPASYPTPPAIVHTPLADPQLHPAPFPVTAVITDNYQVVSATLYWSRNGAPATSIAMAGTSTQYTATIPLPGTNTDAFTYWIVAADHQSSSTNGPNTFQSRYPITALSPSCWDSILRPDTTSNLLLSVTNTGGYPFLANITALWGGLSNAMEHGESGWSHSGVVDLWNLSTNRSHSGSTSWYCGNPAAQIYGSSMHAKLDTPPVYLLPGAQLSFHHWIQCELDGQFWRPGWLPNDCWDGGIVEISTNAGASFQQITPAGGYPNLISGYWASPWPDKTPCFAGTGAWSLATFDLSAFSNSTAIIRFHFGSDENTEEEGWYVDDVVVSPVIAPQPWLSLNTTNLAIPATRALALPIATLISSNIPTGDRQAALWIAGNTPTNPAVSIPVRLHVRSPATLTWLGASQTSTNGTGLASLSNSVFDADGDSCQVEFQWSLSPAGPWSNTWISAVQSLAGTATFDNAASPPVSAVATRAESGLLTNLVAVAWNTQVPSCGIVLSTNTLVRGRTWDGLFQGDWATSQPFMVDNEPPAAPRIRSSTTHWIAIWSSDPAIALNWDAASDGAGIGVENYLYGSGTNPSPMVFSGSTKARTANTTPPGDGTNIWVWLQARDAYGNLSTPTLSGPYWHDTTPPSPSTAVISLALCPFSNYLVGANSVTGSWHGFTETGTGIAGYYFSLQDGGGTRNGIWTTGSNGILSPLAMDQTNTVYVWAQDNIGWIGPAATVSFVALSTSGDWDHDGVSNGQEEIAGTDATQASSALRLGVSGNGTLATGQFILQWPGLTNRRYTIYYSNTLTNNAPWSSLPSSTNIPGVNGIMTYTDQTVVLPTRFYRISVSAP